MTAHQQRSREMLARNIVDDRKRKEKKPCAN